MTVLQHSVIESGGYNIDRSLRFRSSASAYLSRTPATSGNRRKFTLSMWLKRGKLGAEMRVVGHEQDAVTDEYLGFNASDQIYFFGYQSGNYALNTTAVFRDPSAWYHIVMSIDTANATASNRTQIYVNGVLQSLSGSYVPQNYDFRMLAYTVATAIGTQIRNGNPAAYYFDGYLAEVNFIDGQALTPSSFGQTDAVTGVWTPKKYAGTYGTNGFYLDFKNNTSATTLAYDKSGNGNNWTANNISTTAGATYDSMTDVPTLTSATAANYCVLNPLDNYSAYISLQSGNLTCNQTGNDSMVRASFGVSSGKWYWEATLGNTKANVGIATQSANLANYLGSDAYGWGYYSAGQKVNSGSTPSYGASFTTNDVIGVAFDADAGTLEFYKNGASQGTAFTGLTSGPYFPAQGTSASLQYFNFGQRPFSYTPPTGFKALNTFNLPDPVIKKPNQYMDATTWTGDGSSTRTISGVNFQPDFIWTKSRSIANYHNLYDSVRGFGTAKSLNSNSTDSEGTYDKLYGYISAATTSGFSVANGTDGSQPNAYTNQNGITYVGWQWKKGATPGFDIVAFTAVASGNGTFNHSLGVAPKMVILKDRTGAVNWVVYHASVCTNTSQYLNLNATSALGSAANIWGAALPTSTTVGYGAGTAVVGGSDSIAYLFAEIAGFSKFGSYTGNGSSDGPFVYCGFRPKYILVKCSSAAANWNVIDTSRNQYNVSNSALFPNDSLAEQTGTTSGYVMEDVLSNGFKMRMDTASINSNGATYIYAAFASNPFKFSNAA